MSTSSAPQPNTGTSTIKKPTLSRPAKASSGVTRETYGKINTSAVDSAAQLWLAQLPPALAAAIDASPEGTYLGNFTFTKGGTISKPHPDDSNVMTTERVPQKLAFQIAPQLEEMNHQSSQGPPSTSSDILPLDYTLTNITKQSPECTLYPFTRHPSNGSVLLHGSIVRNVSVQVERTQRYREMCKARIYNQAMMGHSGSTSSTNTGSNVPGEASEKHRFVQSIDTIHSLAKVDVLQSSNAVKTAMGGSVGSSTMNVGGFGRGPSSFGTSSHGSGFGNSVAQFGKRLREAHQQQLIASSSNNPSSRKRPFSFTQESSVRTILFELFSQQSHWTLKDLRAACGSLKTDKEIRTELNIIGEYQRVGQMKGMWELKSEFKDNIATNEANTGDAAV